MIHSRAGSSFDVPSGSHQRYRYGGIFHPANYAHIFLFYESVYLTPKKRKFEYKFYLRLCLAQKSAPLNT